MHTGETQHSRRRGQQLGMLLAALGAGVAVLVLIFLSGGFFLYCVLAVAAFLLIAAFHYVLWGHAFTQETAGEREEEQLRQRAAAPEGWPPPITGHPDGIRRP